MDPVSRAQNDPIIVSNAFPTPLRLIFGGVGMAGSTLLLVELGPALWPPNFLMLFFGFIILGGLSVTLSFAAASALAPNQTWEIRPGRLTIIYQLFNKTSVKTYELENLQGGQVRESYNSDGPNTYCLVFPLSLGKKVQTGLPGTPFLLAFMAFLRAPIIAFTGAPSELENSLSSPAFSKREDAEEALARLMGR